MPTIQDGIIIGGAGGAIAGLTISLGKILYDQTTKKIETARVYKWLKKNTASDSTKGDQFKSTRAIASWNNLTEERVRYLCSTDKRIFLSTGEKENMWGIYDRVHRSIYEDRGMRGV